ncbi:hypothetical protein [Nonomuraea sp. NPDC052265]|uniref:hypothetical protein n=1 Tax=Nonomuraea sp. NPDC052265 TaxID=3364374 RepID=UPI0037C95B05
MTAITATAPLVIATEGHEITKDEATFNAMMASTWALLEDAALTPDEWEFIEGLAQGSRGEGELLLSLLAKVHAAGGVAEVRSAL